MLALVTGSSGFVGSHLVKRLNKIPGVITVGVDVTRPRTDHCPDRFVRLDLSSRHGSSEQLLRDTLGSVDVVFHLAAESFVHASTRDPAKYLRANVQGTFGLLEAMRTSSSARLIHVSTCEVYGNTGSGGAPESAPLRPLSPYASTKLAGEALSHSYAHSYGIPTTIVRPFNLYGPGQQSNRLIPQVLINLRRGLPQRISGTGEQTRDWTFISDAIDLLIRAGYATPPAGSPSIFNLASGIGVSVREIIDTIHSLAGIGKYSCYPGEKLQGALMTSIGVPNVANEELDWKPQVSFLDGLSQTLANSRVERNLT
jgi:nucleoside-diphosphate-sugar epimerase